MNTILNTPIFLYSLSFLLGLLIGSFISMLTWRLPRIIELPGAEQLREISLSRSHCPHCHTPLPWYRLFPLFSWLFSKGKCHACGHKISARYPLIELTTALATLGIVIFYGISPQALFGLILTWFLITICVIDFEHYLILDKLSLPLLWIGLLINTQQLYTSPEQAILGAAFGYLILWILFQTFKLLTGKEGMLVIGFTLALFKLRNLQDPIPFGPYLAIGGWITLLYGNHIIQMI